MTALDRTPQTYESLCRDLANLGVTAGMTLMVHSSLRSIGWVLGGPPTVVRALVDCLGTEGTLAAPAASPHCADPATWSEPVVADSVLEEVRRHFPLFDRETTPTTMGAIAETFRRWPGTLRSDHPLESVCARGPQAERITGEHPLEFSEGLGGPFDKLYQLDARVLLLGVGFNRCTALHYAESLVPNRRTMTVRIAQGEGSHRSWLEFPNVADDNDTLFPEAGRRYLDAGRAVVGTVGGAECIFFSMRDLVDFARRYFEDVLPPL